LVRPAGEKVFPGREENEQWEEKNGQVNNLFFLKNRGPQRNNLDGKKKDLEKKELQPIFVEIENRFSSQRRERGDSKRRGGRTKPQYQVHQGDGLDDKGKKRKNPGGGGRGHNKERCLEKNIKNRQSRSRGPTRGKERPFVANFLR